MKKNTYLAPLFGFIGVILTIIAPILWEWYNLQSNLTLVKLNEVKLIEKKTSIDRLKILYNDKEINNLTKLSLKLKNSGTRPITKSEIIEPFEIIFDNNMRILDLSLDKTIPPNITSNIEHNNSKITIKFKLLNPDDELYFSILTDSKKLKFTTKSRIKNIKQVNVISKEDEKFIKNNISWITYIVGIFSTIFLIIGLVTFFNEAPNSRRQVKILNSKNSPIKSGMTKDEYYNYIDTDLYYLDNETKKELKKLFKNNSVLPDEVEKLKNKVVEIINADGALYGSIFIIAISIYGLWYAVNNIFNF